MRRYEVDEHLGGREGLAHARKELANRGLRLILDFVPNHVAPDHPWVSNILSTSFKELARTRRMIPHRISS